MLNAGFADEQAQKALQVGQDPKCSEAHASCHLFVVQSTINSQLFEPAFSLSASVLSVTVSASMAVSQSQVLHVVCRPVPGTAWLRAPSSTGCASTYLRKSCHQDLRRISGLNQNTLRSKFWQRLLLLVQLQGELDKNKYSHPYRLLFGWVSPGHALQQCCMGTAQPGSAPRHGAPSLRHGIAAGRCGVPPIVPHLCLLKPGTCARDEQRELQAQQEAALKRQQQAEAARKLQAARDRQAKQEEADAVEQRRAWIVNYVDQEPSSSDDEAEQVAFANDVLLAFSPVASLARAVPHCESLLQVPCCYMLNV